MMRRILEVLERAGHPVGIVTKSNLVVRDIDILARMAKRNLVRVGDFCDHDGRQARPRHGAARADPAAPPRCAAEQLAEAGIPTTVMVAPVIPAINDAEIERILDAAAACGVRGAGYVLLRLPLEVRDLFREWLQANFPDRERHVFALIRQTRGGKDYDATFGKRMTGGGPYAWMIGKRFDTTCARLGLNVAEDGAHHRAFPRRRAQPAEQLDLF